MAGPTSDPPGAAATSPIVARNRQVSAPIEAMKTHLRHMAETMSAVTSNGEAGVGHKPGDSLRAGSRRAVLLADGEAGAGRELDDRTVGGQSRRDHHDPAEHPLRAEPLVQHPHVIESVEERHDGSVRTDRRGEVVEGLGQAGRLDGEQDQVEGADEIPGGDDLGVDDVVMALPGHPQPVLAQRGGPRRPDQERDIPPALGEQRTEEAAGGPGTDNEDAAAGWRDRLGVHGDLSIALASSRRRRGGSADLKCRG